jgi:hypothetical protein
MGLYEALNSVGNKIFLKAIEVGGPNSLVDLLNGQNTMAALDVVVFAGVKATNYFSSQKRLSYDNILNNLKFNEEYF